MAQRDGTDGCICLLHSIMATPLTGGTVNRIAQLFSMADRELVSALLNDDCGENLPLLNSSDSAAIERIRFAVLKLSGGDLDALQRAVDLAKTDWRDVLVAAGFGSDVRADSRWWPDAPV
jgi:hypothetical protein